MSNKNPNHTENCKKNQVSSKAVFQKLIFNTDQHPRLPRLNNDQGLIKSKRNQENQTLKWDNLATLTFKTETC